MNSLINIIQTTKNFEEIKKYIEKNNIIIKNLNNKNFDIILYLIEFCSSYEIIHYFINECCYDTFNYTCYGLAFRSNQVPLFTAIIKKKFKVADLLMEKGASINYCINNFDGRQISILDYICFVKEVFEFDIEQLKYIIYNGYNKRITLSTIVKLIKYKKIDLLNFIFRHGIYNNDYIIKWLMIYKNKIPLSNEHIHEEIYNKNSISSTNNEIFKLEISNDIIDKIDFNVYQDVLCLILEYHCIKPISPSKMNAFLESAIYNKNLPLLTQILKSPFFDITSVSIDNILYRCIRIFNVRSIIEPFIQELKKYSIKDYLQRNSYEKILREASKLCLVNCKNKNVKFSSYNFKDNLKLLIEILLYGYIPPNKEQIKMDLTYIKEEDSNYLSLIINSLIKVNDFLSLQKLMEDPSIKSKININLIDCNNEQPIATAFDSGSIENFKYLLAYGANPNSTLNNYETRFNDLLFYSSLTEKKIPIIACLLMKYSKEIFSEEERKENIPSNRYVHSIITSNYKIYSSELIKAIYLKNSQEVEALLKIPENKNAKGLWGGPIFPEKLVSSICPSYNKLKRKFTALIYSYLIGDDNIFILLAEGSDVNEKDDFGNTLLFYAILKEDIIMINRLVDFGADFENVSMIKSCNHLDYYMAIEIAIYSGNKDILLKLINIPIINLNKTNHLNNSIIEILLKSQLFTEKDKIEIMENLLKRGCRRDLYNSNYCFPLVLAVNMNSLSIVKLLIKYNAKVNFGDNQQSLLEIAIRNRSLPMVQLLLDHGANINIKVYNERSSLLWYAIKQGCLAIVEYLMGKNISLSIGDDITYEDLVIINQHKDIVVSKEFQTILNYNMYRITGHLLQQIIHHNDINMLRLLLHCQLEINKKDSKGNSLLAMAVMKSNLNIFNYLIRQGADLHSINLKGQSIYDLAIIHCNTYYGRYIYNKLYRCINQQ
ncbi:ankyrin [Piromyces finnis]|uniref:Ankyrin n=1 Tax=Piromyces finnis TaxID=1754191 RepID=A0A1Y1V2W5_9FUNG|nr:ankyrin [Piromyces finnis]|eukprot:ORX46144.1 ankyrin [Piromyces finnis]